MNLQRKPGASPNPESGNSRKTQGIATAAALVLVPLLAVVGGDAFQAFIDFGAGVLSLLSLSGAVVWGLIATDRLLLAPRQRLLAQGIHRATAVASIGFLLLHVTIKITLGKVALIGALLPFGLGISGTNGLIGFGSLAALLMIVAGTTGALRSVFALPGKYAARWRAIHMVAYPAWCFALIHGLFTGRPAATYVTVMYSLTVLGVAAVVSLRLLPRQTQRRVAERIVSMTGADTETKESGSGLRDLSSSPLPGASGIPPQREYQPRPQQDPIAASSLSTPLGGGRTPPRLAAPSPPLYEATPAADPLRAPDPLADTFVAPRGGDGLSGPGSDRGQDSGTGLSAGYRAMSMDATTRMPAQPPGSPAAGGQQGGDVPFAERIPMTEELPIITDEPMGPPGSWPAPSPPRPAQAFTQPPAAPYDTGAVPRYDGGRNGGQNQPYDTGATPQYPGADAGYGANTPYDTGATPLYDGGQNGGQNMPYDTGAIPQYNPGMTPQGQQNPQYDTGATPAFDPGGAAAYGTGSPYGPDGASPYGTGPAPTYDTGSIPAYGTGAVPPYDTGSVPAYDGQPYNGQSYDGRPQAGPGQPGPGSFPYDEAATPGPLYPPPAGEPWQAPAGDRP
ncbi:MULTISPECIES: hypothetical protein [unclassified Streptomyces]|uniref:hypothetical protein n=1 Tax=unclassified Streptomyces TaxID=2593676 RepID=UPI0038191836